MLFLFLFGFILFSALCILSCKIIAKCNGRSFCYLALIYLLFSVILFQSFRINPADINPINLAPRYFFLPFTLTSWILIQLIYDYKNKITKIFIMVIGILSIFSAFKLWNRDHIDLNWRQNLFSCTHFPVYYMPVEYDGSQIGVWDSKFTREECLHLLGSSIHDSTQPLVAPFTHAPASSHNDPSQIKTLSFIPNGGNFDHSHITGQTIYGTYINSDSDVGSIRFHMKRGDVIGYLSGPTSNNLNVKIIGLEGIFSSNLPVSLYWSYLDFSNDLLPTEFDVEFVDYGRSWGSWLAVSVRAD